MKSLNPKLILVIISILMIVQISCEKEENNQCFDVDIGEYHLLENARDSLPYNHDLDIIFKNSTGNRVIFKFRMDNTGYIIPVLHSMYYDCELNPDQEFIVKASGDSFHYTLEEKTDSLGIEISLRISTDFYGTSPTESQIMVHDNLSIIISKQPYFYSAMSSIINQRELNDEYVHLFAAIQPEITLLDKTFYNVYTNEQHPDYKLICYNTEIGIVGFEDQSGNLWVFDSVEK